MVSRSLTEVYVLMRNNAIQGRQIFAEQSNDNERVRLMRSGSRDLEAGDTHVPPPWTDALEEVHYICTRLRTKVSELQARHERQIRRPALDDSTERQQIARLTAEMARLFGHAYSHLSTVHRYKHHGNKTERKLVTNVVLALVTSLQDLSVLFRTAQSNYLKSLVSREERSNAYLDLPNFEELSLDDDLLPGLTSNQTDLLFSLPSSSGYDDPIKFHIQKHMLLDEEENTKVVVEREQEVNKIVQTIYDLNEVYKDLGQMVTEQGTVLDRIDYNIELTQVQVHEGYKQLQKAERYQKNNRKMHCILVLAASLIILLVLLVIVKS